MLLNTIHIYRKIQNPLFARAKKAAMYMYTMLDQGAHGNNYSLPMTTPMQPSC